MRLISGVGICDADYTVKHRVDGKYVTCRFYARWVDMINRCYSEKVHATKPSYKECTVCESWRTFSNFKRWMEQQDFEGKQLDKDIIVPGNKIYSPSTCAFVSKELNSVLVNYDAVAGISYVRGKFTARVGDGRRRWYIGSFTSKDEAIDACKKKKAQILLNLRELTDDDRVKESLTKRAQELLDETQ